MRLLFFPAITVAVFITIITVSCTKNPPNPATSTPPVTTTPPKPDTGSGSGVGGGGTSATGTTVIHGVSSIAADFRPDGSGVLRNFTMFDLTSRYIDLGPASPASVTIETINAGTPVIQSTSEGYELTYSNIRLFNTYDELLHPDTSGMLQFMIRNVDTSQNVQPGIKQIYLVMGTVKGNVVGKGTISVWNAPDDATTIKSPGWLKTKLKTGSLGVYAYYP